MYHVEILDNVVILIASGVVILILYEVGILSSVVSVFNS